MQFFDFFQTLSVTGKIIFIIILLFISVWTYIDSEKRGLRGWMWSAMIFVFPILFPVYIIIRPSNFIAFCKDCNRILPKNSDECYFCKHGIPDRGGGPPGSILLSLRRYFLRFLLDICRTATYFMGLFVFLFKRKFLRLNMKLISFYPWGKCHQIVATEGRDRDIPINTLTYGETLFFSAWKVFVFAGMTGDDVFYDLGSGTGNVVFFANILYGIKAVGIDAIDTFIDYSNKIKKDLSFHKVTFIKGNFLEQDLSEGTVFFTVSTAFDPETRAGIAEKFKSLPKGTKLVTVTHQMDCPHLEVKARHRILFSWGYEDIFLHIRA